MTYEGSQSSILPQSYVGDAKLGCVLSGILLKKKTKTLQSPGPLDRGPWSGPRAAGPWAPRWAVSGPLGRGPAFSKTRPYEEGTALDLPKLGKASKISNDRRRSPEIISVFRNLRKYSNDLRNSLQVFGCSSDIFGRFRVVFGNLQKVLHDLRQSSSLRFNFRYLRCNLHWCYT